MKAKKIILSLLITTAFISPKTTRADMFGGDVVVLSQILANAIQQLYQLKQIYDSANDHLNIIKEINRGIHDAMNMMRTISPNFDPGLYKEFSNATDLFRELQATYGKITDSHDAKAQQNTDQAIAEAISLNNSIYEYTKQVDEVGEEIKNYSHSVSPAGAQKLTAESMGVMIHVLNEGLRAQATGLKLNAQAIAMQNKKDKEYTNSVIESSISLESALKSQNPKFLLPKL